MNQTFSVFRTALLLIVVFQLTSCKKLIDKYFPGHGSGNEAVEDYRIKNLAFTYRAAASGEITTATVYYNQHNNPDSVIFHNLIEPNDPTMVRGVYFVYNNKKKLTAVNYLRYYASGYHRYGYDSTGRISSDTSRFIEVGVLEYMISYPSYDSQGRVISEETYVYESGGFTYYDNPILYSITYPYGSDGNLVRRSPFSNIPVVYDDRINYMRTNEIWMFISRNYSRNNPDAVSTYNNFGLPLGFRNGVVISFLGWGDPYEIKYEKVD